MRTKYFAVLITVIMSMSPLLSSGQSEYESDKFETRYGDLELWFIGHGTLMFRLNNFVIHIDPVRREGDYKILPAADLILVTHSHGDHLDATAIEMITGESTKIICNKASASVIDDPFIMKNGDNISLDDFAGFPLKITALPAYNIVHEREPGSPFHPKGDGNGYLIEIAGKSIYVGGDTEVIPEMQSLRDIDIAFLPMNLPYTMSPEMLAEAALSFSPAILYPYHFGATDTSVIVKLLEKSDIEVRIRKF